MISHPQPPAFSLGVVILAAGASSRMGRPKLLLPWGATSVLGHLIAQWTELRADQVTVVCAAGAREIFEELDRLQFPSQNRILNPAPERGMFSSIQCAARWTGWQSGVTQWAIALGDQPHLQDGTLRALLQRAVADPEKIWQPSWQGHGRHPVVLPAAVFKQLKDASDEHFKSFLGRFAAQVALCEQDDPGLAFDLDTPADYEGALRMFFGTHQRNDRP